MRMVERDDAFLILRRLCEEESRVLCKGRCWGWEFFLFGSIIEVTEEKVVFRCSDTKSVLALRLNMENTFFFYGEPREAPGEIIEGVPEEDMMRAMVGIGLPLRIIPNTENQYNERNLPDREKILFIELPPEN